MKYEKVWLIVIIIILWGLLSGGLYWLSTLVSEVGMRIVAIIFFWAFLASIPTSYYMGKTEARGFLAGADKVMDNILGKSIDAYERRQASPKKAEEPQMIIYQQGNRPLELSNHRGSKQSPFDYNEDD